MYSGRINQEQFLILAAGMFAISMLASSIGIFISINFGLAAPIINGVINLTLTLLTLHLYVRRLHDVGTTGLLVLVIVLLTWLHIVLGFICFLALVLLRPMPFGNQYGPLPGKGRPLLQTFFNI